MIVGKEPGIQYRLAARVRSVGESVTLALNAKAKAMAASGDHVVNLCAGEPDFDTPEFVKEAAIEAMRAGRTRYTPAAGIPELRDAIAHRLNRLHSLSLAAGDIVVSCGAKHAIHNLLQVLCDRETTVLIPVPYWVSYPEQVRLAEGIPRFLSTLPVHDFKITAEELRECNAPPGSILLLNSPGNPTGSVYTRTEVENIAAVVCEKEWWVISDEIYEDLIYDGWTHVSIAGLDPEIRRRTFIVSGVSKSFAMTGWRIGYLAGPRPVVDAIARMQSHTTSNPTSIAQWASLAALQSSGETVVRMREEYQVRRDLLVEGLRAFPAIEVTLPRGAFYLYLGIGKLLDRESRAGRARSSAQFCEALLEQVQVALVPGEGFGSDSHVRLSFAASRADLREFLTRFREFVGALGVS